MAGRQLLRWRSLERADRGDPDNPRDVDCPTRVPLMNCRLMLDGSSEVVASPASAGNELPGAVNERWRALERDPVATLFTQLGQRVQRVNS